MKCTIAIVFTLALSASAQDAVPVTSLSGTVVNRLTREPIPGASLTVGAIGGPTVPSSTSVANPRAKAARTDANGRFSISNIELESLSITIAANGYAKRVLSPTELSGSPGVSNSGIVIEMNPASTVLGVVRTLAGQPANGIQVQLLRARFQWGGRRLLEPVRTSVANDLGEYRIGNVSPGRYLLSASSAIDRFGLRKGNDDDPNGVRDDISQTFYPGGTNSQTASIFELQSGAQLRADFSVESREHVYTVRGSLAAYKLPPKRVWMEAEKLGGDVDLFEAEISDKSGHWAFEFTGIPQGIYTVHMASTDPTRPENAPRSILSSTRISIDADMIGVNLKWVTESTINGRVTFDDSSRVAAMLDYKSLRVALFDIDGVASVTPESTTELRTDGSFQFENLAPGRYRIDVCVISDLADGGCSHEGSKFFLKSGSYGTKDALRDAIEFDGTAELSLNVILGSDSAQIRGKVTNEEQRVTGAQLVLVPDNQQDRPDLYRFATSNQTGQFVMQGVAPGNYKLYAWRKLDQDTFLDPQMLGKLNAFGATVRVSPNEDAEIQVKLISAER